VKTIFLAAALCAAGSVRAGTVTDLSLPVFVRALSESDRPGSPDQGRPMRRFPVAGQAADGMRAGQTGPSYAPSLLLSRKAETSVACLPEIAKAVLGIISEARATQASPGSVLVLSLEGSVRHRIARIGLHHAGGPRLRTAELPADLPRFVQIAMAPSGGLPTAPAFP
jgi:hypothetical protein